MDQFTDREKELLLRAAESQRGLNIFLMGTDGNPGFCQQMVMRMDKVDEKLICYDRRYHALARRVWWIIGVLVAAGIVSGITVGVERLANG